MLVRAQPPSAAAAVDEPCNYGAEPGTDRDEQCDGKQRGLEDLEINPIAVHHHRPTEDAVERRHHRDDRTTEAGDERPGGEEHERREHTDQRGHDEEPDGVGEREATDLEVVVAFESFTVSSDVNDTHASCNAAAHAANRPAPAVAPMRMVADTNRIAGSSPRQNRAGRLVPRPSSAGSVALGTTRHARISTPAASSFDSSVGGLTRAYDRAADDVTFPTSAASLPIESAPRRRIHRQGRCAPSGM